MVKKALDFQYLREQTVGIDMPFETPFGTRHLVYADYTASARNLDFIERYLLRLQRYYANTHTEDDLTGRTMTRLLHQAEDIIKAAVNAGPQGKIVAYGAGCTAAIYRFQQMMGIALPAMTRALLVQMFKDNQGSKALGSFKTYLEAHRPVVFVGPYEHHSNELTWRDGLATVIPVRIDEEGGIDQAHLEELLTSSEYSIRLRIGAFSAASNVTGILTPVHELARLLHRHGALAVFDYAACAPYVNIDMNPNPDPEGGDPSLDAVFISPHKFIGGPGSSGLLVFNSRIYPDQMPPTISGGGTVSYVNPAEHDFYTDIEEREKPGTPGILQTFKGALVFQIKQALTVEAIERREHEMVMKAFKVWQANPNLLVLGHPDPARRVAIVSFNLQDPWGTVIHPRLTTVLLNDLYGIQSRAGCACAGPYGHHLLGIGMELSNRYRKVVDQGYMGLKPGWCRVGFHFSMDDTEVDFIIQAIDQLSHMAHHFLPLYHFDPKVGTWTHERERPLEQALDLHEALKGIDERPQPLPAQQRKELYQSYLKKAKALAHQLEKDRSFDTTRLAGELGELQFFSLSK